LKSFAKHLILFRHRRRTVVGFLREGPCGRERG
jgi:hypothetical protein